MAPTKTKKKAPAKQVIRITPKYKDGMLLLAPTSLLTITEYAKLKKVSRTTVYDNIRLGLIEPVCLGANEQHVFIDTHRYGDFEFGRWKDHKTA